MRDQTIVIVTNEIDAHADAMLTHLQEQGHNVFRLHPHELAIHMESSVEINSTSQSVRLRNCINDRWLDIQDIGAVWYRRPLPFQLPEHLSHDERMFARKELSEYLRGLWLSMNCFWVDQPHLIRQADYKLEQLKRAKQFGFHIPRTMITNQPAKVREFYRACSGQMIYKVLSTPSLMTEERLMTRTDVETEQAQTEAPEDLIVKTTLVGEDQMEVLETIRLTPSLFQEYVPKQHELRVTIIGNEVFAAEIHSQERPETSIDWRDYSVSIPYRRADLPPTVSDACLNFVKSYGLHLSR
ncbi:hypothetical protein DVJ83_17570 (plasmid) [Deinococcus wulumuqiensis]|uniref:MvdD-like pre-ATP grasp domain-containing protein n=1 Tax=Deinococcus wulumuqiensis TaxID=980427 RepID=A0A345IMJ3_9DEIO|nr:hypothetical protein [Deinococcus wulumuqiensis]AXH00916.1 hypothetical protein DVJ83_17570 [Deinococcus wulumuqiensis]